MASYPADDPAGNPGGNGQGCRDGYVENNSASSAPGCGLSNGDGRSEDDP